MKNNNDYNEIRIHNDLINSDTIHLYYKGSDRTSTEVLTEEEKKTLADICCLEVAFKGAWGDRSKYSSVVTEFESFIKKFILIEENNRYLLRVGDVGHISKLRSYKGCILPGELKSHSIAIEHTVEENCSIFISITKVYENILDIIVGDVLGYATPVILTPLNLDLYSDVFLKNVAEKDLSRTFSLSYKKLLMTYCRQNCIIMRTGGDGGELEFTLQIFVKKELENKLKHRIRSAANDNELPEREVR